MKATKDIAKYPKFLRCNDVMPNCTWNKYLLKPYELGEVVKVAPIHEQHSSVKDVTDADFQKRFIKVYRKDENNNYTLPYVAEWKIFELLTTPINSKSKIAKEEGF